MNFCLENVLLSLNCSIKTMTQAGCQWLMPVILATQEEEIRRTMVHSKPARQIVPKTLPQKYQA
jgi:hypothetical protein